MDLLDDGDVGETIHIGIMRKNMHYQDAALNKSKKMGLVNVEESTLTAGAHHSNKLLDTKRHLNDSNRRNDVNIENGPFNPRQFLQLDLIRDHILMRKVTAAMLPPMQGPGLGYLAIKEFTDKTFYEVSTALQDLQKTISMKQGCSMSGLIIDLRGNPGGPLPPALDLAALFLPRGKILTQMSIEGKMELHRSTNRRPDKKTSLLLLTDESTASASEIFVAALQDNSRAKCMGTRTVGKNVAQAMMMLSDGSGLAFTVREYFSPLGRIMAEGVTPDIEVVGPINVNSIHFSSSSTKHYLPSAEWSLQDDLNLSM